MARWRSIGLLAVSYSSKPDVEPLTDRVVAADRLVIAQRVLTSAEEPR
jgi:hypothetical protein